MGTRAGAADIDMVRHKLDFLLACRYSSGWSDSERIRYEELCLIERSLLRAAS